jgi:CelD/BcsL family acetyltransferase involved in cellulose biosynthesis
LDVVQLRRDGRLAAVVPIERRFGILRSPTNYHTPSFGILAEDREAGREALRELLRRRPRRLELAFLERETLAAYDAEALTRSARFAVRGEVLERSPYVTTQSGWPEYEASLAGKMLRELRRRRRRLESQGQLEIVVEDGCDRRDELLDEGFRVEAAAWKGRKGTAIGSQLETARFYREVARWAAERGWLRLAFVRLDARALAFDFAVEEGGRHYLLKTGYDPGYRAFAPAMILREGMIRRAFEVGLESYEFGGIDEPWKLQWSRTTRDLIRLRAFSDSVAGRAEWATFAYARPLAKRILAPVRR